MKRPGTTVAILLAMLLTLGGNARASHRCTLDLSALVSTHSSLDVQAEPDNAPWPLPVHISSDMLISAGGAATLMRTDTPFNSPSSRTFLSGLLQNKLLTQLQAAVADGSAGPTPDCYVPSDPDPPTGESTRGFRYITLYQRFSVSTFYVQHADPDATLLPACETPVAALERALQAAEKTLRNGDVRPLQCSPR
ncbi:MAG TPA: hypothetical protein VGH73_14350 [Thermoanaerobaculia bacterium]|jgi:hypothetical protein